MPQPLISRLMPPAQIRREIAVLDKEITDARSKRDRLSQSIAERQVKRDRLKAQLVLSQNAPGDALLADTCSGS